MKIHEIYIRKILISLFFLIMHNKKIIRLIIENYNIKKVKF